ncbi:MAG: hypothetical protein HWQ44_22125 [Nostoc sp. JL34]|uniref:hypothetical protein n=1 Tax=Nostoc sp. JL34 TaxID=2815397 RepID=UPI001D4F058E|nr:hypothetical protein [Nostoc sp. JL34]MBN3885546.1 hypothetical protein [Nostoc sp. JL34]
MPNNHLPKTRYEIADKPKFSMELFAAARLEATERARFVGLVSALEPLAEQKKFEYPDLKKIVKDTLNKVQDSLDLPDDIKRSLEGSISNLTRESVSHAIKRLIITHLSEDKMALEILEEAYRTHLISFRRASRINRN